MPPQPDPKILRATATQLQEQLQLGDLTSVQIIDSYLMHIEQQNNHGMKLNALIASAPRDIALATAQKLDEERRDGKIRGPFHGIPIIVKDAIMTHPDLGMDTTCGAVCFKGAKPKKNAAVVDQLIKSGIIILGKANMTEFCGHKAKMTTPGWSAVGGQTGCAYEGLDDIKDSSIDLSSDPKAILRQPCGGSSSGSGVGVSAGFSPLSLGTETGGSCVYPASKGGLYSMVPTRGEDGYISTQGVFRISKSFDGIGGMATSPTDLACLIEIMLTPEARSKIPVDGYSSFMTRSWEGLKIGFIDLPWAGTDLEKWHSPDVKGAYENAVSKIRGLGGKVEYPCDPPGPDTLNHDGENLRTIAFYEFKEIVKDFCSQYENSAVHNLTEIIEFNKKHSDEAMPEPHTNQEDIIASLNSKLHAEKSEIAFQAIKRKAGEDGMAKYMAEHDLDILVSNSDCSLISFTACACYPSATVPLGNTESDGRPYGLFLLAKTGREDLMFRFMSAWEATMPKIRKSTLLERL